MTIAPAAPDLAAVKARQQKTWSSGDYAHVASRIVLASERLADSADLRAGWNVLDVACGSGNTSLAAARQGAHVVGVDYVPSLLDDGRTRATAERLDVEFRLGDAEDLPADDDSFDAVVSVFGTMFAPDHRRTAGEIVRVARPGATVALASWTPDGFIGQMFGVIGRHVAPPAGVRSPLLWGTESNVADLFGDSVAELRSNEQTQAFRYTSPEDFVGFFRRWYGPTLAAFAALDDTGREALAADLADLADLAGRHDRHGDDGSICIPASYLETVITLR